MTSCLRFLILIFVALVAACGGGGGDGTVVATQPAGSLRLALRDTATCGYDHVYVTVEKVRIYRDDTDGGAAEVILSPPRRIDLATLTKGVLEELGTSLLPAGHYAQLQLVLAPNSGTGDDSMANAVQPTGGSLVPLETPSALQSGLKIDADFDVAPGQTADLVLDFNACLSVVKAGNSGNYLLKPVMTAHPRTQTAVDNSEFRVNTTTAGAQVQPDMAKLADGGYVVVWSSPAPEGGSTSVYAQRYAADGTPVGGETRISTNTANDQAQPSVAGLADGGYVIAWASLNSSGTADGSGTGIYLQRFAADGLLVGIEQQVNSVSLLSQSAPQVAGLTGGGYVVSWLFSKDIGNAFPGSIPGVMARRYLADGTAAGPEQEVGSNFWVSGSAIAALNDGGYVIAWEVTSKTTIYVYTRRYDASGVEVGGVNRVTDWGGGPALTALVDGGYLLTWYSLDGSIKAQRYAADGSVLGTEVVIAPPGAYGPSVASLDDGGYVVAWFSGMPNDNDVYARRYAADGSPLGSVTRINQTTASNQISPIVAATSGGGFTVTWTSLNQDGDSWGIYARQFDSQGLL
jgi:hypothetical protein